jgi:SpoIID/LytB domain protein
MTAADEYTFTGHGWGHGRGMGQYGALGYAVDHRWNYSQILGHFYNNTTAGAIGNPQISVELLARRGAPLVVTGTSLTINDVPVGSVGLVARLEANGTVRINAAGACSNEGAVIGTYPAGVRISTSSQASVDSLVQVCDPSGRRAYRGHLTVQPHASTGAQTVFNWLPIESYLRGVVPRESPASWGSLGAGRGMEALKAQSVAARSYAWSGGNYASGSKTCDTTACQVYGGAKVWNAQYPSGYVLEAANTDTAIAATAGQVRLMPGGAVARTEFSSSTGGYTAGGTFPAVQDLGDSITSNPNHNWTAVIPAATMAAKLGVPGIRSMAVTGRNGLGADGGRVTQVTVVDTGGVTRTFTGNEVRSRLGLKSDWFSIGGMLQAQAAAIVRALYADILLRDVDSSGLTTWTRELLQGRSQTDLVAMLTRSDEYIRLRVAKAYREVLGREPDSAGADHWWRTIRAGRATVDDVQRRFYDSVEFYNQGGGTHGGFIDLLFDTMVKRAPTDSERQYWVSVMTVSGRAAAVDGIWFSLEAAKIRAGAYYQVFLKREPDAAGLLTWANVLLTRGEGAVRIGIAGSQEYRQLALIRYPG